MLSLSRYCSQINSKYNIHNNKVGTLFYYGSQIIHTYLCSYENNTEQQQQLQKKYCRCCRLTLFLLLRQQQFQQRETEQLK